MQYLILTKAQAKELMAEVEALAEEAFQSGYEAGRKAEAAFIAEATADAAFEEEEGAYNEGFDHGSAQGYDDGYNDGAADSYDDGYEDGRAEAELRAAEAAAFDEQPRIHQWTEGTQVIHEDGTFKYPFPRD